MAEMSVQEFRLTFIFGRTHGIVTTDGKDGRAPLAYLRDRDAYAAWFEGVRRDGGEEHPSPGDLSPPWPAHAEQGFWERYLQDEIGFGRPLGDVSGNEAFRQLVPVRMASPVRLRAPLDDSIVSTQALIWPWGLGVAISVIHRYPLRSFSHLAQASLALREGPYELTEARYHRNPERTTAPLAHHAESVLDQLTKEAFGSVPGKPWGDEPCSIHATVRAHGPRELFDPAHEEVHRMLQAVTSFSSSWESDELTDLASSRVAGRGIRPRDHIVFGSRRGRAIWAPDSFLASSGATHTVGCQYRNLIMGILQTESLLRFLSFSASHLKVVGPLPDQQLWLARRSAGALARLWAGQGSYRSGVMRAQVDRDRDRDDINLVRQEVDQTPLAFK